MIQCSPYNNIDMHFSNTFFLYRFGRNKEIRFFIIIIRAMYIGVF
jgi:hypothetical protein